MNFGPILRASRKRAGLTQEEMAAELCVSRTNISKLENDKMELKAAHLVKWFQVTGAPEIAAALICGVDVSVVLQLLSSTPITMLLRLFI